MTQELLRKKEKACQRLKNGGHQSERIARERELGNWDERHCTRHTLYSISKTGSVARPVAGEVSCVSLSGRCSGWHVEGVDRSRGGNAQFFEEKNGWLGCDGMQCFQHVLPATGWVPFSKELEIRHTIFSALSSSLLGWAAWLASAHGQVCKGSTSTTCLSSLSAIDLLR